MATLSPTLTSLFMNNDIVLLEPISIASVITFGIGGDCLLEELIINASIDDIYGKRTAHSHPYIHIHIYIHFLIVTSYVNQMTSA